MEFEQLKDYCNIKVEMNFFGIPVNAWVNQADVDDLYFFYRHSRGHPNSAADTKAIVDSYLYSTDGFFRSMLAKDNRDKTIAYKTTDSEEPTFIKTFNGWSGIPSILPPFHYFIRTHDLVIFPATVIVSPSQRQAVALFGDHYIGKTSTAVELYIKGWYLLSDHLLVMENQTGRAHAYFSPIGLRNRNYQRIKQSGLLDMIEYRETISADTGPVVLVHAEDLGIKKHSDSVRLSMCIRLDKGTDWQVDPLLFSDLPDLYGYGETNATNTAPIKCYRLSCPERSQPHEIAEYIELIFQHDYLYSAVQ